MWEKDCIKIKLTFGVVSAGSYYFFFNKQDVLLWLL